MEQIEWCFCEWVVGAGVVHGGHWEEWSAGEAVVAMLIGVGGGDGGGCGGL